LRFTDHRGRESCATEVEPHTVNSGNFDVNSFNRLQLYLKKFKTNQSEGPGHQIRCIQIVLI